MSRGDVGRSLGRPPPCESCALWVEGAGGGGELQVLWSGGPGWLHSPALCPGEGSWALPPHLVSLQRPLQEGGQSYLAQYSGRAKSELRPWKGWALLPAPRFEVRAQLQHQILAVTRHLSLSWRVGLKAHPGRSLLSG